VKAEEQMNNVIIDGKKIKVTFYQEQAAPSIINRIKKNQPLRVKGVAN